MKSVFEYSNHENMVRIYKNDNMSIIAFGKCKALSYGLFIKTNLNIVIQIFSFPLVNNTGKCNRAQKFPLDNIFFLGT